MLITAHYAVEWSPEFIAKYGEWLNIPTAPDGRRIGPLSSKRETKFYESANENVIQDIAHHVRRDFNSGSYEVLLLHDCGGITKFDIWPDRIDILEPASWALQQEITHWHCYGCSESENKKQP